MNATSGMVASVAALVATTVATGKSNGGFREVFLSVVGSDLFLLFLTIGAVFLLYRLLRLLFGGDKDE